MSFNWNPIMVHGDGNGNGSKRLFEPVFNLGSIVLIVGLLTGGLGAFFSVKDDLHAAVEHQAGVERLLAERAAVVDGHMTALQAGIDAINALILSRAPSRYTREDASRDFGQVNTRLGEHETRIQRLEARPSR